METEQIIVINIIEEPICELFDNNEKLIGQITSELSLLDVLVQIKTLKLEGYYIIFEDEKISILPSGKIQRPPKRFYPNYDNLCDKLLGI